jgi:hypothetical protein
VVSFAIVRHEATPPVAPHISQMEYWEGIDLRELKGCRYREIDITGLFKHAQASYKLSIMWSE